MVGSQCHISGALPRGKKKRYQLYRGLGGPQGRSGCVRKIWLPPGFDPRTVQPVTSCYTDWAIPAKRDTDGRVILKWSLRKRPLVRWVHSIYGQSDHLAARGQYVTRHGVSLTAGTFRMRESLLNLSLVKLRKKAAEILKICELFINGYTNSERSLCKNVLKWRYTDPWFELRSLI